MSSTDETKADEAPDAAQPDAEAAAAGDMDESRMSFMDHLSELRMRLRTAAIVFLVAVIGSFVVVKQYFSFLVRPATRAWEAVLGKPMQLHFISPTEPFWVYTKIALIGSLLLASPVVIWELWKFVAPGLYKKERRMVMGITGATAGCFIGGAIFGYAILCTPALTYMFSFAEKFNNFQIEPTITMDELTGFMLAMLLGTGVAFELPVVLAVLGFIGIVSSRQLWKFDKYAVVLSAVVGGVLTPGPDVLSQVLMAGPLFALYNVSIVIVWLIERGRKKAADDLDRGDSSGPTSSGLVPTSGS